MSGTHCHESAVKNDQTKSNAEHKSCTIGIGCHFAQALPIETILKSAFSDSARVPFPRFTPSEKTIDLSPPLKPPA